MTEEKAERSLGDNYYREKKRRLSSLWNVWVGRYWQYRSSACYKQHPSMSSCQQQRAGLGNTVTPALLQPGWKALIQFCWTFLCWTMRNICLTWLKARYDGRNVYIQQKRCLVCFPYGIKEHLKKIRLESTRRRVPSILLYGFQQYVEWFLSSFYLWHGGSTPNFSLASHFFPGSYFLLPSFRAKMAVNYSGTALRFLIEYEQWNQVFNSSYVSFMLSITVFYPVGISLLLCKNVLAHLLTFLMLLLFLCFLYSSMFFCISILTTSCCLATPRMTPAR